MESLEEEPRAARYSDLFAERRQHRSDCAYCPFCATIGVIRSTRPELLDHIAGAARELIAAAAIVLEEAGELFAPEPPASPSADDLDNVRRLDPS